MSVERSAGFTLIEVVVALAIVAIGMLAVFKTVNDTVNNVDYLRDRSFAAWIADNRLTEMRLSPELPSVDRTEGDVQFAGRRWLWTAAVSQTPVDGLRRIDVSVRREGDAEDSQLVIMAGFMGATAAAAPASATPWRGTAVPDDGDAPREGGE